MVNTGKRLFFVTVLTFALLVTMSLPAFTQTALAASRPMDKKLTVFYYKTGDKEANRIWLNPEFKFTKSKSSKKKVAVIKHDKMQGYYLQIKKPGKTKLTLYAKKWNGKKWSKKAKKYKTKLTVITYTNGFSSFKVGSTQYAGFFNASSDYSNDAHKGLHGTINIIPSKDWKLIYIGGWDSKTSKELKLHNGSSVDIDEGQIFAIMKHKKSGVELEFFNMANLDG